MSDFFIPLFKIAEGIQPTIGNCIDAFNKHFIEENSLIAQYREIVSHNGFAAEQANMSISSFVNDKDWHIKQAQYHTDRGEHALANDHLKSAKMCTK